MIKLKLILLIIASYYAVDSRKVCYDDLGCFTDDYPFSGSWQRPIAVLPESPEKVAVKFMLYTRQNQFNPQVVRYNDIGSYYNPHKPTKFIIHGFLHNGIKQWVLDIKDNFLKVGDFNIIGVDWSKGNGPFYTQATANTQIVGAEIARFINRMIAEYNANAADFHVIGHSLGSHVAGYAGERVNGLGRITGLDPAGPYFENTPPEVRLDPTDAVFVDVIHSDGTANLLLGLGLMQPVGHADFYPNGGKDQPECPKTADKVLLGVLGLITLDVDGIEDSVACSHMAAVYFFTDSIVNEKCTYYGYRCNNEDDFNAGKCVKCSENGCNQMGHRASPKHDQGTLYLNTQPPLGKDFCLQNFGVVLHSGKQGKQSSARGTFTIQLEGEHGTRSSIEYLDKDDNTIKANTVEHRLVSLKKHLDENVEKAHVYYKRTGNWLNWWWYDDQWAFSSIEITHAELRETRRFCQTSEWIKSGQTVEFRRC